MTSGTRTIPVIIGPFPEPLHGMSAISAGLAEQMRSRGIAVRCIDLSPGRWDKGLSYHLTRLRRAASGVARILAAPLRGRHRYILHLDGGRGLLYDIALAGAARLTGQPLLLYHHSTRYVMADGALMRTLLAVAGRAVPHVFCSEKMAELFRARYQTSGSATIVNNAAWVARPAQPGSGSGNGKLRLGFLSNLIVEKGYDCAIETLAEARRRGFDAELVMAGAAADASVQDSIHLAEQKFGTDFSYCGPLRGEKKADFYATLDVLLFPSIYRHETQSLVVPEALAAGTPVIAFDHRFVGEILGGGGLLVATTENFANRAADWIEGQQDVAIRGPFRNRARAQFETERTLAEGQIDRLIAWGCGL